MTVRPYGVEARRARCQKLIAIELKAHRPSKDFEVPGDTADINTYSPESAYKHKINTTDS
jgi:hypothetical protein